MLIRPYRCALLCAVLLAAACESPRDAVEGPVAVDARYRLLFNGVWVGNTLFELEIGADHHYQLEAFTVPAGKMQRAAGHEVLERSEGVMDADTIRPLRFDHSVREAEQIELVKLLFDWGDRRLRLVREDGAQETALPPATHDRLSYLLAARRLAAAGRGTLEIQVASPEASEEAVLEVVGPAPLEVPFGHYQAVEVSRITPDTDESRRLWFDPGFAPLPLRIVHLHDGSTVDMQLEGFSRRPIDPR